MDIRITPRKLSGCVEAVSSKSDAHRALITSAFAQSPTRILLNRTSIDIETTAHCLSALGTDIAFENGGYTVTPADCRPASALLNCNESGSTLRFMLPVAAAVCGRVSFTGSGRLPQRPIGPLKAAMEAGGSVFDSDCLPLTVTNGLRNGCFQIPGNISSQYISGLLMALPLLGGGQVELTTDLESSGYVNMTISVMGRFGVTVKKQGSTYTVSGAYASPGVYRVEGDWSNAAFFMAANVLGSNVKISGLDVSSAQGDSAVAQLVGSLGNSRVVDLRDIPDALPALAVAATSAKGETWFLHGSRLRLKESDRLRSVAEMITSLGGDATELPEGLLLRGSRLKGGVVDCNNDHRIAMAAAAAATACDGPVTLLGAQAVEKSYPTFFEDYTALGGEYHVI